jgi:hypothetical protein
VQIPPAGFAAVNAGGGCASSLRRPQRKDAVRIQIEPSEIFLEVNGDRCRVWNGITPNGQQLFVLVKWIASPEELEGLIELGLR